MTNNHSRYLCEVVNGRVAHRDPSNVGETLGLAAKQGNWDTRPDLWNAHWHNWETLDTMNAFVQQWINTHVPTTKYVLVHGDGPPCTRDGHYEILGEFYDLEQGRQNLNHCMGRPMTNNHSRFLCEVVNGQVAHRDPSNVGETLGLEAKQGNWDTRPDLWNAHWHNWETIDTMNAFVLANMRPMPLPSTKYVLVYGDGPPCTRDGHYEILGEFYDLEQGRQCLNNCMGRPMTNNHSRFLCEVAHGQVVHRDPSHVGATLGLAAKQGNWDTRPDLWNAHWHNMETIDTMNAFVLANMRR